MLFLREIKTMSSKKYIIIAPFSNQHTRDWPMDHFRDLIALCVQELSLVIKVVGSIHQRELINSIIKEFPSTRVENFAGITSWSELQTLLQNAEAVVSNNSGVGHFSAKSAVETICIFSGSHSEFEWMPRGPHVTLISKRTACSPCDPGNDACPCNKRCLTEIKPANVFKYLDAAILRASNLKGSMQ